jgi:energy-converting hydrogenase A subunit R
MRSFSSEGILVVPGAGDVLRTLAQRGPAYIISTSYCQYVHAVCDAIGFPPKQTFCTRVDLDDYAIPESEIETVQTLARRILDRGPIDIPTGSDGLGDLCPTDQDTVGDLDDVFWETLPDLSVYSVVEEVRPVGGPEKANSIVRAADVEKVPPSEVVYVGDSITDVEAFRMVRREGGLAVSFNGNRWAVEEADIAIISPNADPLLPLVNAFLEGGWAGVEGKDWSGGVEGAESAWVAEGDIEPVVARSEIVRKQVRGTEIGRLG